MAQQTSAGTFQNVYKFNGKELDAERRSPREHKKLTRREQSGLYYYGARYYDPGSSVWLSVDPMMEMRSWISPYTYCLNNLINRTDPTGALDWEPEVDENYKISYRAEKGDSKETLMSQYGLSEMQASDILNEANLPQTGDIKAGSKISGDAVRKVTGSDLLKFNWSSPQATDQRKVYNIAFALLYDNKKGTGGCGLCLNNYISGMPQSTGDHSTVDVKGNFLIPIVGGGKIPITFFQSTASGKTYLCRDGQSKQHENGTTFRYNIFHPNSNTPAKKITQIQMIMLVTPSVYEAIFMKDYLNQ